LFYGHGEIDGLYLQLFAALAVSVLTVMYALYFNLPRLAPLGRRFGRDFSLLTAFNRAELGGLLAWALLRYTVYSVQYWLLLRFFAIPVDTWTAFAGIATHFLVQTSVPLPPVAGLVARGNVAVYLWAGFGATAVSALAASLTLWMINLIIPALIGTFSLFHVNIAKQFGYSEYED
jgi:hypothetical protein